MNYLEPWYALAEGECIALRAELTRELPPGHALQGIQVKCLARRQDRDDVLFELQDGSGRFASVHPHVASRARASVAKYSCV
jgi:hypothetical protein